MRLGALVLPALLAGACVEPHTGNRSSRWCHAPDGVSTVVDDMEDGDASLCGPAAGSPAGTWQMVFTPGAPAATISPGAGPLSQSVPLPAADMVGVLAQSTRALELSGSGFTQASNASASLVAQFAAPVDLTTFSSVQFWALADRAAYIRFNVATAADPPSGARWGQPVPLGTSWAHVVMPLAQLAMGFGASPTLDLTAATGLEFRYTYFVEGISGSADQANVGTFDIWIDDVQLTP